MDISLPNIKIKFMIFLKSEIFLYNDLFKWLISLGEKGATNNRKRL